MTKNEWKHREAGFGVSYCLYQTINRLEKILQ